MRYLILAALLPQIALAGLSPTGSTGGDGGASVSDTAYDATSWDGATTVAPSKNAVRDKIETLGAVEQTAGDVTTAWTNGVTVYRQSAALTANRSRTLPATSAYADGAIIVFHDSFTTGSAGITWNRAGSDTVNGGTSIGPTDGSFTGKGTMRLEKSGTNWERIDRFVDVDYGTDSHPAIRCNMAINGFQTGIFWPSAGNGQMAFTSQGSQVGEIRSTGISVGNYSLLGGVNFGGGPDASISRIGGATWAIGDGNAGDFSGTLKLANLISTGSVTFPAGSAGAPGLTVAGAATGLYVTGGQLAFAQDGDLKGYFSSGSILVLAYGVLDLQTNAALLKFGASGDGSISRISAGVLGMGTGTAGSTDGVAKGSFMAAGTATTCTGGTIGTGSKANAGFVTATTTGTSTIVVTFPFTAPTAWNIYAVDITSGVVLPQSAGNATTATFGGATVADDVIRYIAMPY